MRISRSQSRLIASFGVLLTFLFLGSLLWKRDNKKIPPVENSSALSPTLSPSLIVSQTPQGKDPSLVLGQFHRIETKDGKTVWEVKAERGTYAPQSNMVMLDNATLWLFKEAGKSIELTAPRAQLDLEGTSLAKAVAFDGVTMLLNGEIKITTDSGEFNQHENTIVAPGDVLIEHQRLTVKGKMLTVNLTSQIFELKQNVDTVVLPEKR